MTYKDSDNLQLVPLHTSTYAAFGGISESNIASKQASKHVQNVYTSNVVTNLHVSCTLYMYIHM